MDSGRERERERMRIEREPDRQGKGMMGGSNSKSWEKPPVPPQNLAGSAVVGSFPCPHPEPCWMPSLPCSPFPLGKLLRGLLKSLPGCPPSPSDQAKPEPVGDKEHILPRAWGGPAREPSRLLSGQGPGPPDLLLLFPF